MIHHKRRRRWALLLLLALLLLASAMALAAGESLLHSLVGSGGGLVTTGDLTLKSAVGQPLAGRVDIRSGLCNGFLCGPGGQIWHVYLPAINCD